MRTLLNISSNLINFVHAKSQYYKNPTIQTQSPSPSVKGHNIHSLNCIMRAFSISNPPFPFSYSILYIYGYSRTYFNLHLLMILLFLICLQYIWSVLRTKCQLCAFLHVFIYVHKRSHASVFSLKTKYEHSFARSIKR